MLLCTWLMFKNESTRKPWEHINRRLKVGMHYWSVVSTRSNCWTFDQMTALLCQHPHTTEPNDNDHERSRAPACTYYTRWHAGCNRPHRSRRWNHPEVRVNHRGDAAWWQRGSVWKKTLLLWTHVVMGGGGHMLWRLQPPPLKGKMWFVVLATNLLSPEHTEMSDTLTFMWWVIGAVYLLGLWQQLHNLAVKQFAYLTIWHVTTMSGGTAGFLGGILNRRKDASSSAYTSSTLLPKTLVKLCVLCKVC